MAKLSANGPELLRVERVRSEPDDLTEWQKTTRTFHRRREGAPLVSLQRFTAKFTGGGRFNGGWKRRGVVRNPSTIADLRALYEARGWTIVSCCASEAAELRAAALP